MYKTNIILPNDWIFYVTAIGDEMFWKKGADHGYPPEIGKWYSFEGDFVKKGEKLCQLESGHANGPKGPDLICPVSGKVLYRTSTFSLAEVCGEILVTIETQEEFSSQQMRHFQDVLIQ